ASTFVRDDSLVSWKSRHNKRVDVVLLPLHQEKEPESGPIGRYHLEPLGDKPAIWHGRLFGVRDEQILANVLLRTVIVPPEHDIYIALHRCAIKYAPEHAVQCGLPREPNR